MNEELTPQKANPQIRPGLFIPLDVLSVYPFGSRTMVLRIPIEFSHHLLYSIYVATILEPNHTG